MTHQYPGEPQEGGKVKLLQEATVTVAYFIM